MREFEVAEGGSLDQVAGVVCAGLAPGDLVTLRGPVGAGKTALVQACARRLGVGEPVTSPTFALCHRYAGAVPVAHLDLYRLADGPARDTADLEHEVGGAAVAFVEWPEAGASWLPAAAVDVEIALRRDGARRFRVSRREDGEAT